MTPTPYIVWRRDEHNCYRIWLPQHFEAAWISRPPATDPDLIYSGSNYAEAFAAASQANAAIVRGPDAVARVRQNYHAPTPVHPAPSNRQIRRARDRAVAAGQQCLFG
jgi:hypothetical protein